MQIVKQTLGGGYNSIITRKRRMGRETAEEREQWAAERREYEGTYITGGECGGYMILKHIDGSLFKALAGSRPVYVSQRTKEPIIELAVAGGFIVWNDR